MDKKVLEKKTDINRDEQGYLWGSVFITGGGAITLLLSYPNIYGKLIFITGSLLCLIFLNAFFTRRLILLELIKQLNEKEKSS